MRGLGACSHARSGRLVLATWELDREGVCPSILGYRSSERGRYLAGLLDGLAAEACLNLAVRSGAFAVTVEGDWEGLPSRAELALLDAAAGEILR